MPSRLACPQCGAFAPEPEPVSHKDWCKIGQALKDHPVNARPALRVVEERPPTLNESIAIWHAHSAFCECETCSYVNAWMDRDTG